MESRSNHRRGFLQGILSAGALAAAAPVRAQVQTTGEFSFLPQYARAQHYRSLKQSSYDRTGGNSDRWPIAGGGSRRSSTRQGPGVITHIWFTIAAPQRRSPEGARAARVLGRQHQAQHGGPVGDSSASISARIRSTNRIPGLFAGQVAQQLFRHAVQESARFTVDERGHAGSRLFLSNIDYMTVPKLPEDALYFHAQYRQRGAESRRPTFGEAES